MVPAGSSLQFFEVLHFVDDPEAANAIEAVLRTFDGARDSQRRDWVQTVLMGSVVGVIAWLTRRRKLAAAANTDRR